MHACPQPAHASTADQSFCRPRPLLRSRRVIIFDWGGTLTDQKRVKTGAPALPAVQPALVRAPLPRTLLYLSDLLEMRRPSVACVERRPASPQVSLCRDPRNTIFIATQRSRQQLAKALGHIPRLGLAAELGFVWRLVY